jgi:hypothetical protein
VDAVTRGIVREEVWMGKGYGERKRSVPIFTASFIDDTLSQRGASRLGKMVVVDQEALHHSRKQ